MMNPFLNINEIKIEKEFNENGYVVLNDNDSNKNLIYLKNFILKHIKNSSKKFSNNEKYDLLNDFHKNVSVKNLNEYRLSLINKINSSREFKKRFFFIFKEYLNIIVGSELAIQKKFNLSIQLPKDSSSLLPMHSDVWSGDSPFEVVAWLPLVNVYKTKSMYILPPKHMDKLDKLLAEKQAYSSKKLFDKISKYVTWIDLRFGEAIIFNQMLPHGNIVNMENETRWSINCRFKGVFTPYGDKKIGEFFEPITLKPISKIAMNYKFPKIK